jgi:hypothetical protein
MNYRIKFTCNGEGEPRVRSYKATSPGHAFEKCLREFPGAKLIEGRCEARLSTGTSYGGITYAPPSTVRVVAEPTPKTEEIKFPFWNDCVGSRRDFSNFAHVEQNSAKGKRQLGTAIKRPQLNRTRKETKNDPKRSVSEPMAQGS